MTTDVSSPLLSVVVPTRNRQYYAENLIRALNAFDAAELEVVIQDNSRDATLGKVVDELKDPRFHYFYCAEPLNMHQNFDRAIDNARGEFICAIGDDDGILVDAALAGLHKAKAMGVGAVLMKSYSFNWPGTISPIWGDMGGPLSASRLFSGMAEQLLDPEQALDELFRRGALNGLGLLPRVYHGFVSRSAMTALKEHCGTCFPGASPDLANAVGLVPFVGKALFEPRVALISGHSPGSGGGQGAARAHHSELEVATHLPRETISNWDPAIPRFWSGTTVYAQTAVEAARAVGLIPKQPFEYVAVSAACLLYQPEQYRERVRVALRALGKPGYALWPTMAVEFAATTYDRARSFIRNLVLFRLGLGAIGRFESIGEIMLKLAQSPGATKLANDREPTQV